MNGVTFRNVFQSSKHSQGVCARAPLVQMGSCPGDTDSVDGVGPGVCGGASPG